MVVSVSKIAKKPEMASGDRCDSFYLSRLAYHVVEWLVDVSTLN